MYGSFQGMGRENGCSSRYLVEYDDLPLTARWCKYIDHLCPDSSHPPNYHQCLQALTAAIFID